MHPKPDTLQRKYWHQPEPPPQAWEAARVPGVVGSGYVGFGGGGGGGGGAVRCISWRIPSPKP